MPFKDVSLSSNDVLNAFRSMKTTTDEFIVQNMIEDYCDDYLPKSDELAIAIFCNAFEELGCPIRSAAPGERLEPIQHLPEHAKFASYMYFVLEKKASLIEVDGQGIIRTCIDCPSNKIEDMMESILDDWPALEAELRLMHLIGKSFSQCLSGKADALKILFGPDGRDIMTDLYAKSPIFSIMPQMLAAFIKKVGSIWTKNVGPLRILELGAGTGGTTSKIVPVLAHLGIEVVYTVSDVSASFLATTQTKFGGYDFVEFKVVNIEQEPDAALQNTQHIVLCSNVIHATRNLSTSMANIQKMLLPDGFTIFHELTTQMLWLDIIFGLLSGWWRFDDGRQHALQSPQQWKKILEHVGFNHVNWTDGHRPEAEIQHLISALASDPRYDNIFLSHRTCGNSCCRLL